MGLLLMVFLYRKVVFMKLLDGMAKDSGQLLIGGVPACDLAEKHSTPLYIVNEEAFKKRAQTFTKSFKSQSHETRVIYASKAFTNLAMAKLAYDQGLFMDVVSQGEFYTALKAGVDPKRIYFHGNNKTYEEVSFAIDHKVGTMVVDSQEEFELLESILEEKKAKQRILLRINPLVSASTHKYIQTSNEDSKFGVAASAPRTKDLLYRMAKSDLVDLAGIHCHIGSQVLDPESFFETAKKIVAIGRDLSQEIGQGFEELNLGGGFGVYYTSQDDPIDFESFLPSYIEVIEKALEDEGLDVKILSIEPGRSLINEAGATLYRVGLVKEMDGPNDFVFVDGGMGDNPRPSLYKAKYEACLPQRLDEKSSHTYTLAGKCCESGDILIEDLSLPEVKAGDLILVSSTGAYNYSMSSNYNRIPRPAVVFVGHGQSRLVVKRETLDDLIRNDII